MAHKNGNPPPMAGDGLRVHDHQEADRREDSKAILLGQALGEAACHAEGAYQSLVRSLLVLDAADIEPSEDFAAVVEAVGDASTGLIQLADQFGGAMVARSLADRAAP